MEWEGLDPDKLNFEKVALDQAAKTIVEFYEVFRKHGLSVQEAAALTAAILNQGMPLPPSPPPMED